jgi:hypothetical protein
MRYLENIDFLSFRLSSHFDFSVISTVGRNPCPEQSEVSFRFLVASAPRNDISKGLYPLYGFRIETPSASP